MNDNIKYDVWLQQVLGYASHKTSKVLAYFENAKSFYLSSEKEKKSSKMFSKVELEKISKTSLDLAAKIVEECNNNEISIITYQDVKYPERLRNIYNPPTVLYFKGELPDIDNEVPVALVGTRSATKYGANLSLNLGYELTKCGMIIVSGGALGIDTEALRGALKAKGKPICVLGGGLNKYYPQENEKMFDYIIEHGVLLSEYPPDTNPIGRNFPVRNRILAGLALATVVVEAPKRSGALITANLSLDQGKDVFAVPGNIGSYVSDGVNELLKLGAAPLTSYKDVLDMYVDRYDKLEDNITVTPKLVTKAEYKSPQKRTLKEPKIKEEQQESKNRKKPEINNLSDNASKLYEVLSYEPQHLDEITRKIGLDIRSAMIALTELQLRAAIEEYPGKRFTVK